MSTIFAGLFATLVTLPLLTMFVIYFISRKITRSNKKSFHYAIDLSTVFFILAVHYLIVTIWGKSLFLILTSILLLIGILIVIVQYKIREELDFSRVAKGFWRLNFLLFFVTYFCLSLYGIIKRTMETFAA
ncbi:MULTISPECIES: DUF3397 domain-containing protein [Bacillus]|uniref:DUF3397 domain-containing protein n=1 Tax=Bacillus TaxID=1386 RepID=UPI000BB73C54|nr:MULTISPECIES: DUF3397 domain-containing protein [Bacillus]